MSEIKENYEEEEEEVEEQEVKVSDNKKKKKKKKTKIQPSESKPTSLIAKLALQRLKQNEDELARLKALKEEEERKIREEEERIAEEQRKIEEEKERKRKIKQDKILAKKKDGTYLTKSQKEKIRKNQRRINSLKNHGYIQNDGQIVMKSIIDDSSDDEEEITDVEECNLRAPIFCILGHVDTGKTSLLDYIRSSNVQEGEAGKITQQIGATHLPRETLVKKVPKMNIKIPGLLMIDTPGHAAFSNLRARGSSVCDIAIVLVDIIHGLEPQTIQSLKMLMETSSQFVIALNKIDRLYGWKKHDDKLGPISIQDSLNNVNTFLEFKTKVQNIKTQIMEQGINSELFWDADKDYISICPISAHTGEGVSDLLKYIIEYSQLTLTDTQDFDCTILDIVNTEGYGITMDVILKNGELREGDKIRILTSTGHITTTVRNILTPPPNKESRVATSYIHHKCIKGSMGIKIIANDLGKALAGSQVTLYKNDDTDSSLDKPDVSAKVSIELDSEGVMVHASSQGSLEALVHFLKKECEPSILVSHVNIGNVLKKDLIKAQQDTIVLAFDVKVDEDAESYAKLNGIKIFTSDIIYHLFDKYNEHIKEMFEKEKEKVKGDVVFPCILQILPNNIYNKKNPIILGVDVLDGNLHLNTPLLILPSKLNIGRIVSIQHNQKDISVAKKGMSVCIKIENVENPSILYGRHFTHTDTLYSSLTRKSVDILKKYYKKDLKKDDITLLLKLKKINNWD